MMDTKENILHTALRLFAKNGYQATSVSDIAGELGITKGALYKHYQNKQDIFNNIVERMYQMDMKRAQKYEVPEETLEKSPIAYQNTKIDKITVFIKAQFHFWTVDDFGRHFRQMLTLEQYRNTEIMELYQKCLVIGPVHYMENVFSEMIKQGICTHHNPKQLALEFYAPFYLLVSLSDTSPDYKANAQVLSEHIEKFIEKYIER